MKLEGWKVRKLGSYKAGRLESSIKYEAIKLEGKIVDTLYILMT